MHYNEATMESYTTYVTQAETKQEKEQVRPK